VRGEEHQRATPADLSRVPVVIPNRGTVELSQVANIVIEDGPIQIIREDGQRFATVLANVRGRDLVGFVDEAKTAINAKVDVPKGYTPVWGGQFENQQRAAARLAIVVPIALGTIFLLLYLTFGSVRQAALVFCNVPFATIGGVIALWASGQFISVPASVGFIALMGIAVLNGVVLISYISEAVCKSTLPFKDAVMEGARRRLRPVVLTASIAALGLSPFLLASGPGAEIQRPLAIVVIGGLVSATALTLILLPVLYYQFGLSRAERRRIEAKQGPRAAATGGASAITCSAINVRP
jgi:cobalt-zinc-cadmium resistance protein CzcA